MTYRLEITWQTHTGFSRRDNQDTIWVNGQAGKDDMRMAASLYLAADEPLAAVVCDGIGGGPGGREASEVASVTIGRLLESGGSEPDVSSCVMAARAAMQERSSGEPHLRGFGTTVAAVHIRAGRCTWFNLGDSRIYSLKEGFLRQLSLDHVLGAGANTLTGWIGDHSPGADEPPWWGSEPVSPGTVYLACSDGLFLHLSAEEIRESVSDNAPGAVESMLERCLHRGGKDNIAIVRIEVKDAGEHHDG